MRSEADIKREIRKKLLNLESSGMILWFERLQSGAIHNGNQHVYMCRKGTPDFEAVFVNKIGSLCVLFVEVKKEGVYAPRKGVQKEWSDHYGTLHTDMMYMVAQSVNDMVETIMHYAMNAVDKIEFNPDDDGDERIGEE